MGARVVSAAIDRGNFKAAPSVLKKVGFLPGALLEIGATSPEGAVFEVRLAEDKKMRCATWHDIAIAVVFRVLTVPVTDPSRSGLIERRRGFFLLGLYAACLVAIVQNKV